MDSTNRPPAVQAIFNLVDRIDADGRHDRIADPIAWRAIRDDLADLADEIAIQMANLANQRDNAIAQAADREEAATLAAARLAATAEQAAAAVDEANHRAGQAAAAIDEARTAAFFAINDLANARRDADQAKTAAEQANHRANVASALAGQAADREEAAQEATATMARQLADMAARLQRAEKTARLASALAPLAGDTESQTPAAILARFEADHASALAFFELTARTYEGTYNSPEGTPARIELWHGAICEQIVTPGIDPGDLRSFFEQYRHIETLAYHRGQTEAKKAIAAALGL